MASTIEAAHHSLFARRTSSGLQSNSIAFSGRSRLLGNGAPLMRGRKPIPTYLREIQGNPQKRPLNKREPRPAIRAPSCPRELSEAAKKEWRRLARQLVTLRLITDLDRAMLASYCQAFALWAEAVAAIRKFGAMVKSPSGFPMQSPYVAIANKQAELMIRIAAEFGLTPSSRSRIAVPPAPIDHLPAAAYLR